jgi:tRNA(Ile)-lysidine synthase
VIPQSGNRLKRDKLEQTVMKSLIQAGLSSSSRIIGGVSGGPDSLSMLHVLHRVLDPGCLTAAHLNHSLRPQADEEAQFVMRTAVSWDIPCRQKKVDINRLAHDQGWSIEEAGRNARYRFFASLAGELQAEAVLVAHNADDQAETLLLHLLRGSGLTGLRGMRQVSPLPGAPQIKLVRPLLSTSRESIEAYCQAHDLDPMIDNTNLDPSYLRNRLRHELRPHLARFNPQIKQHLQQLAEVVAADEALLENQNELAWRSILREQEPDWLRLDLQLWRNLPLSLRRRILRKAVKELRPSLTDISFRTIELAQKMCLSGETGAKATLPGGLHLRVQHDHLLLTAGPEPVSSSQPQLSPDTSRVLSIPGKVALENGWYLAATVSSLDLTAVRDNRDSWRVFVDVGEHVALEIRSRRPGERFQPLGMDGRSASIQDVMVNRKLPAALRTRWPLVVAGEQLVWLVGLQIDERAKVSETTRRIIQLHCWYHEEEN